MARPPCLGEYAGTLTSPCGVSNGPATEPDLTQARQKKGTNGASGHLRAHRRSLARGRPGPRPLGSGHAPDRRCLRTLRTHSALYDVSTSPPTYLFSIGYVHGEDGTNLLQEYTGDYYPQDERIPRLFRLPLNRFASNEELYTEQERKTSVTYNDCLPRIGSNNQLLARLAKPGRDGYHLDSDPSPQAGDWPAAHVVLLQALLPHIHHALDVHHALVSAEVARPTLAGLLDTRQIGAIFLDQRGQIIAVNDRAQVFLGHGSRLSDQGGVLRAQSSVANATLGRLLARALHGRPARRAGPCDWSGQGVSRRSSYTSVPVTTPRTTFGACALPVLVLLLDPHSTPDIDADLVATVLNLTPAESQVAVALAEGHTVHDIAVMDHTGRKVRSAGSSSKSTPRPASGGRPTWCGRCCRWREARRT